MPVSTRESKKITHAGFISLWVSILVLAVKFYGYHVTHSSAVFSDAVESIVNVLAAGLALWVLHYVMQPADREHPYGHGKMEYFSAAFEGGLIFFAAIAIVVEATRAFVEQRVPSSLSEGLFIVLAASLMNFALGVYLKVVGRREGSVTLQASGSHVLSDVWTSIGVFAGIVLVMWTGLIWLDPLVSILMACHLAWTGFGIVKEAFRGLLDEQDDNVSQQFCETYNKIRQPGLINIHNLRMIRSGHFQHIDVHVVVPEFWDVAKTHQMTSEFERKFFEEYPFDGEIAFHIDPCQRKYCEACDLSECPIRQKPFVQVILPDVHSIREDANE